MWSINSGNTANLRMALVQELARRRFPLVHPQARVICVTCVWEAMVRTGVCLMRREASAVPCTQLRTYVYTVHIPCEWIQKQHYLLADRLANTCCLCVSKAWGKQYTKAHCWPQPYTRKLKQLPRDPQPSPSIWWCPGYSLFSGCLCWADSWVGFLFKSHNSVDCVEITAQEQA